MTDLAQRAKDRVPRRFWDARLNDATKSCKQVKKFLEGDEVFLLLTGSIGIGKTYACYAGIIEREEGGVYHKAVRLSQLLFTDKRKTIQDIEDTGLLVLDDIGTEIITDKQWFDSILGSLIDYRYEWMRKTIITTNLTVTDFSKRYGERITSRLSESGSAREFIGKDIRKSEKKPVPQNTEPLEQKTRDEDEILDITPEQAAENKHKMAEMLRNLPPPADKSHRNYEEGK